MRPTFRAPFVMGHIALTLGLLAGSLGLVGLASFAGLLRAWGDYALRVLIQEHSLALGVLALPALVGGAVAQRLNVRRFGVRLCFGLGLLNLFGCVLPLYLAGRADTVFQTRMVITLGADYASLAGQAPVQIRPQRFNLRGWLNLDPSPQPLPTVSEHVYRTVDGQALQLDLYQPLDARPHPMLVLIHGGGLEAGDKYDTRIWAAYYAAQGYLVASVQYRLAPEAHLPAPLQDVQCAIGWLRQQASEYHGDPSWVGVMGYSSGGHLALLAGFNGHTSNYPSDCPAERFDVQAVVAHSPVTDAAFYKPAILGVTPEQDNQCYNHASPLAYAQSGAISPPVLIVHGQQDEVVSVADSTRFHAALTTYSPIVFLDPAWSGHIYHVMPGGLATQLTGYYADRFLAWSLTEKCLCYNLQHDSQHHP